MEIEFALSNQYNPGDDFYNYVNSKWLQDNPIPKDKTRWGTFDVLRDTTRDRVKNILRNINYNSSISASELDLLINLELSNKNINNDHFKYYLNKIIVKLFTSKTKEELIKNVFEIFTLNGLSTPISFSVEPDFEDSNINILNIDTGGLGLPSRDYYVNTDKESIELLKKYRNFMSKYLDIFIDISDESIDRILEFEKLLANITYTNVEKRDPEKLNNPTTYNNLINNFKYLGLNELSEWLNKQEFFNGKILKKVNVSNIKFIMKYEEIIKNTELNDLIHYFIWQFLLKVAPYLSEEIIETKFEFYGKILSGAKENEDREDRIVDIESMLLGDIIGKIYINKYFSKNSKKMVRRLVKDIINEFRNRLEVNEWMGDVTKKNAIEKLNSMNFKIGYPEKFKDYSLLFNKLSKENSFIENCLLCYNFEFIKEFSELYNDRDSSKWFMNVFDINAYYSPQFNEIVFPAGILQEPFFSENYDFPLNFGGIGVVIGHEITHGFDDQGRKYDKFGNLKNWYEDKDIISFNKQTQELSKQFYNYKILDLPINGDLTLGENIADLGGVSILLSIVKKILSRSSRKKYIDSIKRFFYNYARVWRINIRDEEIKKRLLIDPHSPGLWRVNGILPNIDDFYEIFNISNKNALYIDPNDRVNIW